MMAVIFGDQPNEFGWIKVTSVAYKINSHESGYSIDSNKIPQTPSGGNGVGWEMYYHDGKKEFKFEQVEVPLTQEESILALADSVKILSEKIDSLKTTAT